MCYWAIHATLNNLAIRRDYGNYPAGYKHRLSRWIIRANSNPVHLYLSECSAWVMSGLHRKESSINLGTSICFVFPWRPSLAVDYLVIKGQKARSLATVFVERPFKLAKCNRVCTKTCHFWRKAPPVSRGSESHCPLCPPPPLFCTPGG